MTSARDEALLSELRSACLAVAAQHNRSPSAVPFAGMCVEVSLVVRGVFGGDLVCGSVNEEPHYWNLLPSGEEIDLTSDQFGGDGYHPMAKGSIVEVPSPLPLSALSFAAHVLDTL